MNKTSENGVILQTGISDWTPQQLTSVVQAAKETGHAVEFCGDTDKPALTVYGNGEPSFLLFSRAHELLNSPPESGVPVQTERVVEAQLPEVILTTEAAVPA